MNAKQRRQAVRETESIDLRSTMAKVRLAETAALRGQLAAAEATIRTLLAAREVDARHLGAATSEIRDLRSENSALREELAEGRRDVAYVNHDRGVLVHRLEAVQARDAARLEESRALAAALAADVQSQTALAADWEGKARVWEAEAKEAGRLRARLGAKAKAAREAPAHRRALGPAFAAGEPAPLHFTSRAEDDLG